VATIRPYDSGDLDSLYDVCIRTADAGGDATHLHDDVMLPGHVFAAPYAVLEPERSFVAADDEGVGGYVLGALDTSAFDARAEAEWWPPLRERYPAPDHARGAEWTQDEWHRFFIHTPITGDPTVVAEYPSHLHIDLLPRLQGIGLGGALMDRFLDTLRAGGSPGVHLGVSPRNERAVGFYRHYGLTELDANELQIVFAMTL